MKNEQIKISIIIPVYKVEKFLDDCITSVTEQTYKNIEIILVDDGSPDNCPQMCDEWAKKDSRIKVIHKQNGGLSSARNAGLDIATGDYIMFVDSDDAIHFQICDILLNEALKNNSDITMSSYKNVSQIKQIEAKDYTKKRFKFKYYRNDEIYDLMFNKKIPLIMVAWMKLYKKEIFNELRFEVGKIHEDEFIIHKIFAKCKLLSYVNLPLYYYLVREDSIIHSNFSSKHMHAIEALEDRIEFTSINKPQFLKKTINKYIKICILYYYKFKLSNVDENILNILKQKIDVYYKLGYRNFIVKMFYKHPRILQMLIQKKIKNK